GGASATYNVTKRGRIDRDIYPLPSLSSFPVIAFRLERHLVSPSLSPSLPCLFKRPAKAGRFLLREAIRSACQSRSPSVISASTCGWIFCKSSVRWHRIVGL